MRGKIEKWSQRTKKIISARKKRESETKYKKKCDVVIEKKKLLKIRNWKKKLFLYFVTNEKYNDWRYKQT